ncbi:MAG: histidine kinase [Chitinophagaceae bacterium]|nr:histidine kinase [Chitinophagaceae bacterium]MCW5926739.1 histidine kinase [Chitinophagaceae bacterium]
MVSHNSKYWLCQAGGWSFFALINVFLAYTYGYDITWKMIARLLAMMAIGIPLTHLLRNVILSRNWLALPYESVFARLFLSVIVTGFVYSFLFLGSHELLGISELTPGEKHPFFNSVMLKTFDCIFVLFIWVLIYYLYHYFQRNKKREVDTFKLQSLVKELELKTIKAHINPHFIFNALNSIRALVDEDPPRARSAITELSNILRSSLQVEKMETVPLKQELDIVKDYLALEQMRFEERLKVDFEIDEDTLQQPVPPMMLQTLAENAIKHGISRQVNGGRIVITSDFVNDHHEITVRNTGLLNGHASLQGFGIKSTIDRLKLLYGSEASFEIKDIPGEMVEARLVMPVQTL